MARRRLHLSARYKKSNRRYREDVSVIRLGPLYPNHIWSVDLMRDKLSTGVWLKTYNHLKRQH